MAAKRIGIMDIRQIIQFKKEGLSNRKISDLIGVHRNSTNHYVRLIKASKQSFEALLLLSDLELKALFPSTTTVDNLKYNTLSGYFEHFRKELKKPGCTKQVLWIDYKSKEPDGYAYTQFLVHFRKWLKQVNGSGKLVHKAGEKVFIDYAGKKLSYVDRTSGEVIEVEVFVAILPCSHYTFVEASPSQKLPDFIASMNNCLRFFGGVPLSLVTDNLKSAVSKASKYEPTLNKTFKDFALHYSCAINPTRSAAPKDKALVENAVKLAYQRIYYPLNEITFFSLHELNKAIQERLKIFNATYKLSHIGLSREHQFLNIEKTHLRRLPSEDYQVKQYCRATVQKMGYVFLSPDKNYYSVPYRFIGKKVELAYDASTVTVQYKSERIALHKRSHRPGNYTTIKDHLSSTHQFYKSWSPEYFTNLAKDYGSYVVQYLQTLIADKPYPEIAYKQCLGILALSKLYSKERLNNACKKGLTSNRYGYHIIQTILRNNMDSVEQADQSTTNETIEAHPNIRGASYYK